MVFITNGPPLAISSLMGFPEITKNLESDLAFTFNCLPFDNNIRVLSFTLSCFFSPITISPFLIIIFLKDFRYGPNERFKSITPIFIALTKNFECG